MPLPTDNHSVGQDNIALPLLRLGQNIAFYHSVRYPEPYETKKECENPEAFLKQLKADTAKLQHHVAFDPCYGILRTALNLHRNQLPDERHIQVIALVAHAEIVMLHSEDTPDSIAHRIAPMLSDDLLGGKLAGRRVIAELFEVGVLTLSERLIHTNEPLRLWLSGNNPLCVPSLTFFQLHSHLSKIKSDKTAREAKAKGIKPPSPPPWLASPASLYHKLREVVIGQDEACRVLATRGWLHLKRAELLRKVPAVGSNECLFFISQQSGVGKTWLAENYGKLCCLPFVSFSATDATTTGYVGLDIVEDSLKMLLKASGNPNDRWTIPRARRGILFYDEFTKKRSMTSADGRDINGAGVQAELLRVMEGCKVQLGNRRQDRENAIEYDTTGNMFIFGGYVEGFDKVIGRLNRKGHGMGFVKGRETSMRDAYLYDALVDYGFIPEFVNRLTKIVMFRRLTACDLEKIALSSSGVIASYNQILAPSGLSFKFNRPGIRLMAELSVDTGQMARGLRLIVSSLVEDAVFNGAKGEVGLGVKEVKAAIERATSVHSMDSVDANLAG